MKREYRINMELETEDSKGVSKKYRSHVQIAILVIIIVALSVAVNFSITGMMTATGAGNQKDCPFECCVSAEYAKRPCQGNYDCVENKCMKKDCPNQCCPEGEYKAKECGTGYLCFNNLCKAMDSDNDGLPDLEETKFGTNSNLYDTDSDTLNDYFEINFAKTDPLNRNTDGDRYMDGADPEPTKINTARIEAEVISREWEWNEIGLWALGNLKGTTDMLIATGKVDIKFKNTGNDYTEYVDFDLVFLLSGKEVKRMREDFGRLEPNSTREVRYASDFMLSDIKEINITDRSLNFDVTVENIEYEKF